jgi:tetraprenyl-beta-curcumene synthase
MNDPFADRASMTRAVLALGVANLRYWTTVAPPLRAQLRCWDRCARTIPDEPLRALAGSKLHEERFNVELAATLATLAPRARRAATIRAIVALQVMYDYLDLLTEQPQVDPVQDGPRLFEAFTGALGSAEQIVDSGQGTVDCYGEGSGADDGGYLRDLAGTVELAVTELPAWRAVAATAARSAERCAQAQVLSHAAARSDAAELERWARRQADGTTLRWPEYLAGATGSVLAMHALIAAAADPNTTERDAQVLDAVYLSICALTMLDSLVDREQDLATGELGYIQGYGSAELMAQGLATLARAAARGAAALPNGAHHIMTLVGVAAYYGSAPTAASPFARPIMRRVHRELRPLIVPTLAVMRAWRLAKRARRH